MYFTDDRLRVLISGAASGIGLACAQAFAARGAELVLSDLDGTALTRVAERLGADSCLCDSMSETSVATFGSDISARYSSLDVLVNSAGSGYVRSLSMVRLANVLLPLLCAGRGRRFVVNVASVGGFTTVNDIFSYASSLAAFDRLSEAMAEQVRGSGIEVVGFTPRMARAKPASRAPDQLYRAQRVDVHHSAQLFVERVAGRRTDWIRATADHRAGRLR